MAANVLQFNVCLRQSCLLRFPGVPDSRCPRCGEVTKCASPGCIGLKALFPSRHEHQEARGLAFYSTIFAAYTMLARMFRSADGAGVVAIYLGGITPTPEHPSMQKTALGADQMISWSHHNNGVSIAQKLIANGHKLWGLEQTETSESIFSAVTCISEQVCEKYRFSCRQ